MAHENKDDGLIRRYLLAQLGADELQQLEEKMMTDNELFNRVLLAEDEMVEEYVQGELPDSDRARFEASFLSTPEGRQQVTLARALSRHAKSVLPASDAEGRGDAVSLARERVAETPLAAGPAAEGPEAPEPSRDGKVQRLAWWGRPALVPYLRVGTAVVLLGLGLFIWWLFRPQSDLKDGLASLNKAYQQQRPIEPRISEFAYAPMSVTRGDASKQVDTRSLNRAGRILHDLVAEHPNAASHHALGRLYLAEQKFDDAIKEFEDALKTEPNNAQLHSDYGAAMLELGRNGKSKEGPGNTLEQLAEALEHLNRALELDKGLLEALFNRALLYQQMILPRKADEDWRKYLDQDSSSPWADEVRRKLNELEGQENRTIQSQEQLLQEFINAYLAKDDEQAWKAFSLSLVRPGNFIANSLLDAYLDLAAKGRSDDANSRLQMLTYAGEIQSQRTGDRFITDLTLPYRRATPAVRAAMARARSLMRLGNEHFLNSNIADAKGVYSRARNMFAQDSNNAEAEYAQYRLGHCYLRQPDILMSLVVFEKLAQDCKDNDHQSLLGRTLNAIADAHFSLNDYSTGFDNTYEALNISERIGDTESTLRNVAQLASEFYLLSDYSASVGFLQRGFAIARENPMDLAQLQLLYSIAASDFAQMDFYAAAIAYQEAALSIASQMGAPLIRSRGHAELGLVYAKTGNLEEAIKNATLAFQIGERLPDKSAGKEMMAHAALWQGHIYRQTGDFTRAIANYSRHIQSCDELKFPAEVYVAHKGKLLCHIALGDDESAESELQTTLNFFEQYRSKISEESNRNAFFDNEQSIYDVAIDFAYSRRNDAPRAFEYSETSRARSLLDLANGDVQIISHTSGTDARISSVTQPLKLAEIRARIPEQCQILQYAALRDKLLIFVISRTGLYNAEQDISEDELSKKLGRYQQLVSKPRNVQTEAEEDEEAAEQAKELYDLLIKPIEAHLDKKKYICIVADKSLHYVPFNALISSTSNKYLVEDYLFGSAPSSTLFVKCTDIARSKNGVQSEGLLSVGNPLFDRAASPSHPDLPSSATEAERIAEFYNSSTTLVGARASESQVRSEMPRAEVIHFAMHYIADGYSPMLSKFLLAKEPTRSNLDQKADGFLQPFEIYAMKLPRSRLVVLSACQTAIERAYRGEGAISVARPFLCAGVPVVVASLWQVESDPTAHLMIDFHMHRKVNGLSTAEALRAAQLRMLHSLDRRFCQPYFWASFAVIGGYATF